MCLPHQPYVPQIPSKWQEQKHNRVLSNYTDDHTEPINRKKDTLMRHMLALLVKTQTIKLHLAGGRVASCRNCYNESAIISVAEHSVMTSSTKIYYLIKTIVINN